MTEFSMNLHGRADDRVCLWVRVHWLSATVYAAEYKSKAKSSSAQICDVCGGSFLKCYVAAADAFQVTMLGPQ
jgi:hypothetical protein